MSVPTEKIEEGKLDVARGVVSKALGKGCTLDLMTRALEVLISLDTTPSDYKEDTSTLLAMIPIRKRAESKFCQGIETP